MQHATINAAGADFHVVTTGTGPALLLLHGWPEYWQTWELVMIRLGGRFTLIAPDLRGFGASAKPGGPWGPDDHARDILALLDAMGAGPVGVVGHDVGGAVMLSLARMAPERLRGLFFFDFAHPAIGKRMGTPDRLNEIWYQSFNQMDMAPALVGASRDTCRAYIGHFLKHWSYRKDAFDDVMEDWVDNFQQPGNLAGGFAHYRAVHAGRIAMMQGAPPPPPIGVPTCVRWAEHDPIFPYAWTDTLPDVFTDLDLAMFKDVGHFPHREAPDEAAAMIAGFFTSRV
jgi:pimeloyl-ACP methyl ester carboxylesterase